MGQYVYSPAGAVETRSRTIQACVEYIGNIQTGKGSNLGKGIRYLRSKIPNCSGRAIKRAIKVYPKIYKHDFERYGLDVYCYHIDKCADIVKEIIEFILRHSNDEDKIELFGHIPSKSEYIDLIYGARLSQLRWAIRLDYMDQYDQASLVEHNFNNLKI